MRKRYFVYIMSSLQRTLYVGVTNDLARRVEQHRAGAPRSFSARYRTVDLVYVEMTNDVRAAIAREKQIKSWRREKKRRLVLTMNPEWRDLSGGW